MPSIRHKACRCGLRLRRTPTAHVYCIPPLHRQRTMKVVYGLIGILAIVAQTTGAAQELRRDTLCASVWFTAGSSAVDPAHEQNGEALDRLVDRLRRLQADPATRIDAVTIRGWASPDGSSRFNRQLAETRARRTADTLARRTALPEALFAFEGASKRRSNAPPNCPIGTRCCTSSATRPSG